MDFLDPKKKRAHTIRLLFGYFLMAIAISIGTLILLLEAFGYDLYNRNGEVIQNGLVFVDSRPSSADILVNGRPEGRTDERLVLPEDIYNFQLIREGYQTWTRDLNLRGHSVERLTYPLLIPEKLETENLRDVGIKPSLTIQSPDRKWLVLFSGSSLLRYQSQNLNDLEDEPKNLLLPEELFSLGGNKHNLRLVEWSDDNKHALIRHDFEGGYEFIVINHVDPEQSFNLNGIFNISLSKVSLNDRKYDRYHLQDNQGNLWAGEAPAGRLTPLAKDVITYKAHGSDAVLIATKDEEKPKTASIQVLLENEAYELRELPLPGSYLLDIARYDDRWYLVAGSKELKRAYIYRQPFEVLRKENSGHPAPMTVLRLDGKINNLSFSSNTRFIGANSGSEFAVYDAEHDRQYRYEVDINLPKEYKVKWMDGFRYSVFSEEEVVIFDFDGSNRYELSSTSAGTEHFYDRDYKNLFTLTKNETGNEFSLIRTFLLAERDR